ncbi:MAG: hypothetical protein IKN34_09075 [Treponema sp.]|nr:hypothetical protein [Treponema sp.]
MKKIFAAFALFVCIAFCSASAENFLSVKRQKKITPTTKINYDFTKLNYNIASGLLFDMLVSPDKYVNKTMKIHGQFYSENHDGMRSFAILIWDLTGCCPTGTMVAPLSEMKYPNDFPKNDEFVTVTGFLEKIKSGDDESLYLVAEKWE